MTAVTVWLLLALSVLLIIVTGVVSVRRVRRAYSDAVRTLGRARPVIDELTTRQRVMQGELARISASAERLSAARRDVPRRGHPGRGMSPPLHSTSDATPRGTGTT